MATNTNYKDFEDDVIKELKRQLRPSVSDIIEDTIGGIVGFFLDDGIESFHAELSPLIKRPNLNEEMYRCFLEENYRDKFDECNGNTDKIAELKTTALTRLLEWFRGQVSQ